MYILESIRRIQIESVSVPGWVDIFVHGFVSNSPHGALHSITFSRHFKLNCRTLGLVEMANLAERYVTFDIWVNPIELKFILIFSFCLP